MTLYMAPVAAPKAPRMLAGLLILGAFGAATGAIYSVLKSRD